jgi:exoribonuclease R
MDIDTYKLQVHDRNYTKWSYHNMVDYKITEVNIQPVDNKLFHEDVITLHENIHKVLHSNVRTYSDIPGVLILKDNKTFGRASNGKLLYKCIPDDKRLPIFFIPYEMKNIGFTKVYINQYITFKFTNWKDKHPHGGINQVIGSVDKLDNFYEYQLYCKSLHASIQNFNRDTCQVLKNKPHDDFIDDISRKYVNIEDRSNQLEWFIFSIDPKSSTDFDDAFSIKSIDSTTTLISIYISNVTLWLDILGLWDSFSQRISTIYLPDKKRPMLPTILSDCLCSLIENRNRIALVMDIYIEDNKIIKTEYKNVKIKVSKNFRYENKELIQNENYTTLVNVIRQLSRVYKYVKKIRDSHDVVSYLMVLMNYHTAKIMINNNNGILRSTILNHELVIPEHLPENVGNFMKYWNSTTGKYLNASKLTTNDIFSHDLLEMEAYVHITSPIRRIVDLLNIIQLQQNLNLINLSDSSLHFYNKWVNKLDYINTTMRYIRKVQNDCSLLHTCVTSPEVLNKQYNGYIFDKMTRDDGLFHYIIYLPELNMTSKITIREEMENYQIRLFQLYIFNDEENLKKKIRLQLL